MRKTIVAANATKITYVFNSRYTLTDYYTEDEIRNYREMLDNEEEVFVGKIRGLNFIIATHPFKTANLIKDEDYKDSGEVRNKEAQNVFDTLKLYWICK